jgi:hypothetical protein
LDIFGFEILNHNSFEQLCINYTNEMLQQHFNNNTFKLEEEIYQAEGIVFAHIEFIDNGPMIALITEKRKGVLPMLDEEIKTPGGNDKNFLTKLADQQNGNPVYKPSRKNPLYFVIKHYAGDVDYDGEGFLEKNRDTLNEDTMEMLQTSKLPLMDKLYPKESVLSTLDRKASLGTQFRGQLDMLMTQLYRTEPHYIRCIKPNEQKAPLTFVAGNCYEQLTYCGVFEAVAIRKQGFPFRLGHTEFAERYQKICPESLPEGLDLKGKCTKIVGMMQLNADNCRIGNTRVLYRALEYRKLELDWSIATKNERILLELERLLKIDTAPMTKEAKEEYITELAMAVRESDLFRIKVAIANDARKLLEKFIEERVPREIKERLSIAKQEKDRGELEELIELCDNEGYIIKIVRECRELLDQVVDADDALNMAMSKMDEQFLEKALVMCKDFDYNGPLVKEANRMLKGLKKAKQALDKALSGVPRQVAARKAITLCEQVGYVQDFTRYSECVEFLGHLERTDALLEAAKDSWDIPKLEAAIAEAAKPQFLGRPYECQLVEECQDSLKKVIFLTGECARAITQCIESQVRAVVKRGNQLQVQTEPLDKLRHMVNGDYKDFLGEQYKRAKKIKDHARAVRVMVKRADLKTQGMGTKAELAKFEGLKKPKDWLADKPSRGMGLLSAGMLRYQNEPLHGPLTIAAAGGSKPGVIASVHSKMFAAKYTALFGTVQRYMGQGAATAAAAHAVAVGGTTPTMADELHTLLGDGVRHKQMRDEIYLYIIKQCTNNPAKKGSRPYHAAWELLAMCLTVFPPSKGFEMHLEHWIRSKENSVYDVHCCRGLVRRRIYEGVDEDIPTAAEIKAGSSLLDAATNGGEGGGGGGNVAGSAAGDDLTERTVTLDRSTGKKLGIRLGDAKRKCGVPVVWVDESGQAASKLSLDDAVVAINGNDVRGLSSAKAGKYVKEAEYVVLTVGLFGCADNADLAAGKRPAKGKEPTESKSKTKGKQEAATASSSSSHTGGGGDGDAAGPMLSMAQLLPGRLRLHEFEDVEYIPRQIEDTGPDMNVEVPCGVAECKRQSSSREAGCCQRCLNKAETAAEAAVAGADAVLGAGGTWQAVYDHNSQRYYYFNAQTQVTQWEQPFDMGVVGSSGV